MVRGLNVAWCFVNAWVLLYLGVRNWVTMPDKVIPFGLAILLWSIAGAYDAAENIYQHSSIGYRSAFVLSANIVTSWSIWKMIGLMKNDRV